MEPMPDKIQGIDGKAGKKHKKQPAVHRLLLKSYFVTGQMQRKQHEHGHAAVDIGPVVQPDLCLHISNVSGKHVKDGKIGGNGLGK